MGQPLEGFGTYFYPPIIYEENKASFKFCNNEVHIRYNGYLSTNNKDEEETEDIFNAIFLSTSLLKSYTVLSGYKIEFEIIKGTASGKYFSPLAQYAACLSPGQPGCWPGESRCTAAGRHCRIVICPAPGQHRGGHLDCRTG